MGDIYTNAGKALTAGRIKGSSTDEPVYSAWGTSGAAAAATDTTLGTESPDESRIAGTSTIVTTTLTNDTYQVVALHTCASNPKTITESGLLTASSSGTLFVHSSFAGIALAVGEKIEFTYKLKSA